MCLLRLKTKMSRQHTVSRKTGTQGTICAKEADLRESELGGVWVCQNAGS